MLSSNGTVRAFFLSFPSTVAAMHKQTSFYNRTARCYLASIIVPCHFFAFIVQIEESKALTHTQTRMYFRARLQYFGFTL